MLSPISSPPPQITPEEHASLTSSTPAEFTSAHRNPPILRYHDSQASSSVSDSGFWEGQKEGVLWVTEESESSGWTLPYTSLTLHALTPASPNTPAHLYLQSDESDAPKAGSSSMPAQNGNGVNGHDGEANEEEEDDGEFTPMREIRVFVAADKPVQTLFSALSHCSALHASLMPNGEPSSFGFFPSNDDIDDDEYDEDDGAWEDADEDGGGAAPAEEGDGNGPGRALDLAHLTLDDPANEAEDLDGQSDGVDPVEDFLAKVNWGDTPKPKEWEAQEDNPAQ